MTPAYSPESGLAEGFVHTLKRDYVSVHELHDAEPVLAQLGQWFDDYNRQAPHSALGMRPPAGVPGEPRTHTPMCLANREQINGGSKSLNATMVSDSRR